jgi:hypothetical protein
LSGCFAIAFTCSCACRSPGFSICAATAGGQRQADDDAQRPQEREVLQVRAQATRRRRRRSVVVQIGTLNEGALHAQLKEWYRRPGDLLEQVTGGFVVDLVRVGHGERGYGSREFGAGRRSERLAAYAPRPLSRAILAFAKAGSIQQWVKPGGRSADNRRRRLWNAPEIVSSGSTTIIAAEVEDGQFRS